MKKRHFITLSIFLLITSITVVSLIYFKAQTNIPLKLTLVNKALHETIDSSPKISRLTNLIEKSQEKSRIKEENRQIENKSILTTERIYTEQEINEMTEAQFVELLKDTEIRLPKLSDIRKLPAGALHHTPAAIILAGKNLGVIKEVLKIHHSYSREAAPFYQKCAKDLESLIPVRAICLTNLIAIKKNNNEYLNLKDFPDKLIELTKLVTDM